jgi:NAD(P)-dependent dehydrogenase (short-subunit alcohol dehydrogenase family)
MAERAAIVTGASSGIGLALAHMLGEEGHALTIASRRPEKLEPAAEELRSAGYEVEERRVPWRRGERDDIDALTGQRVVPVLVLGREAICDSRRILEHLRWRAGA